MELADMQDRVVKEYRKNGFLSKLEEHGEVGDLAELGLIGTEVAEAMEAVRHGDEENIAEECADIIIRTLNFMARKGIDAETEVLLKDRKNRERPYLHGKSI